MTNHLHGAFPFLYKHSSKDFDAQFQWEKMVNDLKVL